MGDRWNAERDDLDDVWAEDDDDFAEPVLPAPVMAELLDILGPGLEWEGGAGSFEELSGELEQSQRGLAADWRTELSPPLRRAREQLARMGVTLTSRVEADEVRGVISIAGHEAAVRYSPKENDGNYDVVMKELNRLIAPSVEYRRWRDSLAWDGALYYGLRQEEWARLARRPNLLATLFVAIR